MNIELTLLSDSISGSGTGIASIIDQDITYDEFGIPYIPAKRIRGILRESALELFELGYINDFDSLFSTRESELNSNFYLDNGYIQDYKELRALFNTRNIKSLDIFNKEFVLDYFTYERTQTSIDEKGVAKENNLRTIRVLKKGLKFIFHTNFDDSKKEIIEKICKITQHFGISRTRGFGNIKLELKDSETTTNNGNILDFGNIQQKGELKFYIKNQSPLLLNSNPKSNQETDTYISGTVIKGVLAKTYLDDKTKTPEDDDFKKLFLSEDIFFLNAYPCTNQTKLIPCPNNIVKDKVSDDFYNLLNGEQYKEITDNDTATKNYSGYISENFEKKLNVKTDIEYHHRRAKDRTFGHATQNDGEFFQFEVIKENQMFAGSIIAEKDKLTKIHELLKRNQYYYFGKSRVAQYSKCSIQFENVNDYNNNNNSGDEKIYILLESDMILENDNGFIVPDINVLINQIKEDNQNLDLSFVKESSYIKTSKIGGFMFAWKMPKEQIQCFKSGSVIVLKNSSKKEVNLRNAYGLNKSEGFGRIKVLDLSIRVENIKNIKYVDKNNNLAIDTQENKNIVKFIIKKSLERSLMSLAIKNAENIKIPPSSFITKLRTYINESNNKDELKNKISNFKDTAKKNLSFISNISYINSNLSIRLIKPQNNQENQDNKVNLSYFSSDIDQSNPIIDSNNLKNLIDNDLKDTFYPNNENDYFELYKFYMQNLLHILKLKGRMKND